MNVHDVFTPDGYPEHTYVERDHGEHEENLKFHLQGPATIVSLSGPSKAGKTMLMNNVVDRLKYNLVTVHGSNISSVDSLWDNVLDQLSAPNNREYTEGSQEEIEKRGGGGLDIQFARANAEGSKRTQDTSQETTQHGRRGLKQIEEIVDLDEFVLYIDDAHYIEEDNHKNISEGVKEAYEKGMSICVAFIPYRSDDLTRANPDLSGRVESITLDYWDENDLEKIGKIGFRILKRFPNELVVKTLARESIGSPHLMQKLCLEMCNELNIFDEAEETTPMQVGAEEIKRVLRRTGNKEDYTTVFEIISGGAANRGAERNSFFFRKGRNPIEGDVYDAILRAIAANPPQLTLDQNEIFKRINSICVDESPRSGNVTQAIQRMDEWISNFSDDVHVFDWVDERKTLEIPDPYLIFYLRWSNKLEYEPDLH